MRKTEQKEFCERYDARRTFYNCQLKVPQVSSKLETLFANSKIECRELYENQMEKITDAKKLAICVLIKSVACYMQERALR